MEDGNPMSGASPSPPLGSSQSNSSIHSSCFNARCQKADGHHLPRNFTPQAILLKKPVICLLIMIWLNCSTYQLTGYHTSCNTRQFMWIEMAELYCHFSAIGFCTQLLAYLLMLALPCKRRVSRGGSPGVLLSL